MNDIEEKEDNEENSLKINVDLKNSDKEVNNNSNPNNEELEENEPKETINIISDNDKDTNESNNTDNYTNINKDSYSPLGKEDKEEYIENNKLKDDHYILIERTKHFNIPYFTFGFTTHFYFPSEKLEKKMKLSEIPNPPFTIGPECKNI